MCIILKFDCSQYRKERTSETLLCKFTLVLCVVVVMVNHRDEVEDDDEYCDTGLEDVEDHKNVILQLLSQLKLGMDLTKVCSQYFSCE